MPDNKPENNFYLELLNKHINRMKNIIKAKENFPKHVYDCILAGLVIQANCILESSIIDFHSDNFNEISCDIYKYRQLLVHYSDYRTFSNIEAISKSIIKKFEQVYKQESKYFSNILNYKTTKESNVVIKKTKDIIYDEFNKSYVFKNGDKELSVSADKVTLIKEYKKGRTLAYIVNCDNNMNYFSIDDHYNAIYQELEAPGELKQFFHDNFLVEDEDTIAYKEMARDMLDKFYSGSFSTLRVNKVKHSLKEEDMYADTGKLLSDFFNDRVVYKDFIDERTYSTAGAPDLVNINYDESKQIMCEILRENVSERDYFFIKKAIAMYGELNKEIKTYKTTVDDSLANEMAISMLINFVDHSVKNLTGNFITVNKDFDALYKRVIDYRNFFAHNIYQLKPQLGVRILNEFKDVSQSLINVFESLNIEKITKPLESINRSFLAIERDPKDFVNFKYEQYVKADPTTYMGDKLFYSTKGSNFNQIIGLVPNDKHGTLHGAFFDRKGNDFIERKYRTRKGNKKKVLLVTKTNFQGGEDILMDINLKELFYINAAYNSKFSDDSLKDKIIPSRKKYIVFTDSEENNFTSHVATLEDVISNYYQQRYLPFELAKPLHHKLVSDETGKYYFQLLDENDNLVAAVIDDVLFRKQDLPPLDEKYVFSITDLNHVFSRKGGR